MKLPTNNYFRKKLFALFFIIVFAITNFGIATGDAIYPKLIQDFSIIEITETVQSDVHQKKIELFKSTRRKANASNTQALFKPDTFVYFTKAFKSYKPSLCFQKLAHNASIAAQQPLHIKHCIFLI